jgi:hypothetical protein
VKKKSALDADPAKAGITLRRSASREGKQQMIHQAQDFSV